MTEELPTLPAQYEKPQLPKGPHTAHPKQSAQLFKLAKMLMRPKMPRTSLKLRKPIKKPKTIVYY